MQARLTALANYTHYQCGYLNGMHRIREALEEMEIDQAELARRMGTTAANISRKLAGKRRLTLKEMEQYAQAIGVPTFRLVAGSEHAQVLNQEEQALLAAFNALDEAGRLTMLAEFVNKAHPPHDPTDGPRPSPTSPSPPKH